MAATLLYGLLNFLYKVSAEKGYSADRLVNVVGLTVASLSFLTLVFTESNPLALFTKPVLTFAAFNGMFYALGSLSKFGALKKAPASIVFPLNRLNTVLVMLIGILYFQEIPRPIQIPGIILAIGVLVLITLEQHKHFTSGNRTVLLGGMLALIAAVFTSLSMTVGKLMADTSSNRLAYICASYTLVFLFTLGKQSVVQRGVRWIPELFDIKLFGYGVAIGALNFVGYFLVLQAFGSGPISLSQGIFSSSILIPIFLSRWVYQEKLTPMRLAALACAILSVVFITMK